MSQSREIAASAATWVVEHGLDYAAARRKAIEHLGLAGQRGLEAPDALQIEDAVREHLALFHAQRHASELRAMRMLAAHWMRRLDLFNPHLGGAVWRGTATADSPILLDLYTDDPTGPEVALLNQNVAFETGQRDGRGREPVPLIGIHARGPGLSSVVPIEISVWPVDGVRGALKPDARGHAWRGSLESLQRLLDEPEFP